jgi:hypothetical protein
VSFMSPTIKNGESGRSSALYDASDGLALALPARRLSRRSDKRVLSEGHELASEVVVEQREQSSTSGGHQEGHHKTRYLVDRSKPGPLDSGWRHTTSRL